MKVQINVSMVLRGISGLTVSLGLNLNSQRKECEANSGLHKSVELE